MAVTPARHLRIGDELWSAVNARAESDGMTATGVVVAALGAYLGGTVPAAVASRYDQPTDDLGEILVANFSKIDSSGPAAAPERPQRTVRPRCQRPGTRVIGGWCPDCQIRVESGGTLPAGALCSA